MCIPPVLYDRKHILVHTALRNKIMHIHFVICRALPPQAALALVVKLIAPVRRKPNNMPSAGLQVQSVCTACRMHQQHIDQTRIPVVLIVCIPIHPHAQLCFCKRGKDPFFVMLVSVKGDARLSVQACQQLHVRLDFTVVEVYNLTVVIINCTAAELQQLACQHPRRACCDNILVDL